MNKFFKRFLAYMIDIFIVSTVASCIMYIPGINKDTANYNKYYKEYNEMYNDYSEFIQKLNKYYKDNKLTSKEYEKLVSSNTEYKKVVDKYYKDGKLTKSNYKKLSNKLDSDFGNEYKNVYYKISRYSIINNIVYIVVIFIYFVGINILTKGQTVGKKILKLKIVNNKNPQDNVSFISYVIRALVLYNPLYYLALVIGPCIFDVSSFYTWSLVWSNIKNYLEIVILVMIIIRADGRGLHDLLASTKVVMLDENNNVNIDDTKTVIDEESSNNDSKDSEEVLLIKDDNSHSKKKSKKKKKVVIDESENNK